MVNDRYNTLMFVLMYSAVIMTVVRPLLIFSRDCVNFCIVHIVPVVASIQSQSHKV